jgi:hypothetical protein
VQRYSPSLSAALSKPIFPDGIILQRYWFFNQVKEDSVFPTRRYLTHHNTVKTTSASASGRDLGRGMI